MSLPLAISIHHFINTVGADVGFASIIGLAILVLLYFAQARETASLRAHAEEAAERIQQLEARVAQLLRTQSAQTAAAAQATSAGRTPAMSPRSVAAASVGAGAVAARGAAPQRQVGLAPCAPAGVGAPALADATRLIPLAVPEPAVAAVAGAPAARVASGVDAGTPVALGAAARAGGRGGPGGPGGGPGGPGGPGGGLATAPERDPLDPDEIPDATFFEGPAPATVAGGTNGSAHPPTAAPRPVSAAATMPPPLRAQSRPGGAGRRPMPPPPRRPQAGPSRGRRAALILLPLLAVAAIAAAVVIITGKNNSSRTTTNTAQTNAPARRRTGRRAGVVPSTVTVAVLNGTSTPLLAHRVATKLTASGYKEGNVSTAADQTHTTTIVAFLPNFRRDAAAVASALKLPPSSVQAVDQTSQSVACPQAGPCSANVIVTVGSDLANTQ